MCACVRACVDTWLFLCVCHLLCVYSVCVCVCVCVCVDATVLARLPHVFCVCACVVVHLATHTHTHTHTHTRTPDTLCTLLFLAFLSTLRCVCVCVRVCVCVCVACLHSALNPTLVRHYTLCVCVVPSPYCPSRLVTVIFAHVFHLCECLLAHSHHRVCAHVK